MSELFIRKSIDIDAPVETVWKVLTDNEYIPQYMFNCITETDWKPGSPLLWYGAADHKLYVKGRLVTVQAPEVLEYTVIDPNSSIEDIPANYLNMRWAVGRRGERGSTLDVSQGDYSTVADGQKRYQDTLSGDDTILKAIKKIAEEANAS